MSSLNDPSDDRLASDARGDPAPGIVGVPHEGQSVAEPADGAAERRASAPVKGALRELVETVVLALVIFVVVRTFVMNYRVIGYSMQPNIEEGQFLLIDKLPYKWGEPRRGDIIVLHPPDMPDEIYIKRIIALTGETVQVVNGRVLINGRELDEPWGPRPSPLANWGPAQIGEGELFVMGDNRPGSRDSRYFGMLPRKNVIGRAFLCYWSPAQWTMYPRYDPADLIAAP